MSKTTSKVLTMVVGGWCCEITVMLADGARLYRGIAATPAEAIAAAKELAGK
jgi:hypothetical protein